MNEVSCRRVTPLNGKRHLEVPFHITMLPCCPVLEVLQSTSIRGSVRPSVRNAFSYRGVSEHLMPCIQPCFHLSLIRFPYHFPRNLSFLSISCKSWDSSATWERLEAFESSTGNRSRHRLCTSNRNTSPSLDRPNNHHEYRMGGQLNGRLPSGVLRTRIHRT